MKLQSAVEFLSTYGFMLLIVAIIILVIFYFAFPSQSILPNQCTVFGRIGCNFALYDIQSGGTANVIFHIQNTGSSPINVINTNVIINNVLYKGTCSPTLLPPGNYSSICWAKVTNPSGVGSQVKGYFVINANVCTSDISQFGNAIQSQCSTTQTQFSGQFTTYSGYITANTIPTSVTSVPVALIPFQVTLQSSAFTSAQNIYAGDAAPVYGNIISGASSSEIAIYYSPPPDTFWKAGIFSTCSTRCSLSALINQYPFSTVTSRTTFTLSACDESVKPVVCASNTLTMLLYPPTITLTQTTSPIVEASPGGTDTAQAQFTSPSADTLGLLYCRDASLSSTCTPSTQLPTNPYNIALLGPGIYTIQGCDLTYMAETGASPGPKWCSASKQEVVYWYYVYNPQPAGKSISTWPPLSGFTTNQYVCGAAAANNGWEYPAPQPSWYYDPGTEEFLSADLAAGSATGVQSYVPCSFYPVGIGGSTDTMMITGLQQDPSYPSLIYGYKNNYAGVPGGGGGTYTKTVITPYITVSGSGNYFIVITIECGDPGSAISQCRNSVSGVPAGCIIEPTLGGASGVANSYNSYMAICPTLAAGTSFSLTTGLHRDGVIAIGVYEVGQDGQP